MVELSRLTDSRAVQAAIAECMEIGRDEFLRRYGYGKARSYFLVSDGGIFDSKAIVGAAFGYQFDSALQSSDFSGGESAAVRVLTRLGFRVDKVSSWHDALTVEKVEEQLETFRTLGRDQYLAQYGGAEAAKFFIEVDGNRYDAKAVLVCALRSATGISGISHHEIEGTERGVARPLRALGFRVTYDWPIADGQVLARKSVHDKAALPRRH